MASRTILKNRPKSADPFDRIELRIDMYRSGVCRDDLHVNYWGTQDDLIAAGIVTPEFFIPQPGRKRVDAAGRWVWLRRPSRLSGIVWLHYHGDPLIEPRLPRVTVEAINEAFAEYKQRARELLQSEAPKSTPPNFDEADLVFTLLKVINRKLDSFPAPLPVEIGRHLVAIERLIDKAQASPGQPRPRPSFLHLVVDNTSVPS